MPPTVFPVANPLDPEIILSEQTRGGYPTKRSFHRLCPGLVIQDDHDHHEIVENDVRFIYVVEMNSTSNLADVLFILEENILDIVAKQVLECSPERNLQSQNSAFAVFYKEKETPSDISE